MVVPPDIIDEESSSDTLATEGMAVALVCKARGNPRTQIAWRREDGKPIRLCQPDSDKSRPRTKAHSTRDKECREGKLAFQLITFFLLPRLLFA